MRPALLGLDIGGSGAKAGVFAVGSAECLGSGYVEYRMTSDVPGQAEQDAEGWWEAAVGAIQQALDGIDPASIQAVGVSCTNGLVAVDADGHPLRPAIMLWDQRAFPELERIARTIHPQHLFKVTGNRLAAGAFSLPTMLWLKHEEPETFRAAHKLLVPGGYLVGRLTHQFTIDHSRACTTLLFDIERLDWHGPFLDALGIPGEKLPQPLPGTAPAGTVTAEAAALTGLRRGTPVVAGCMDTVAASIGCGVVEPGECFVVMGTAARVCTTIARPRFDDRFMNCTHVTPQRWLAIGALNGIGSSLRWVRDTLGQVEAAAAQMLGQNVYDLLTAEAAQSPPGSKGLIFLPYISGERTPIWNPKARSVWFGITLGHQRCDLLRSVLEGTAFAIRQAVEILEAEQQLELNEVRIGGSAARNAVWNQIIADVVGKPVVSMSEPQIEPLGAALIAGFGLGMYPDVATAIAAHARPARVFTPDLRAHMAYDELFPLFKRLYEDVAPYFARLSELQLPQVWVNGGNRDGGGRNRTRPGRVLEAGVPTQPGERLGR